MAAGRLSDYVSGRLALAPGTRRVGALQRRELDVRRDGGRRRPGPVAPVRRRDVLKDEARPTSRGPARRAAPEPPPRAPLDSHRTRSPTRTPPPSSASG